MQGHPSVLAMVLVVVQTMVLMNIMFLFESQRWSNDGSSWSSKHGSNCSSALYL